MKPEIRYARTSDGVNIAYFDSGSGPTLFDMPTPPYDHVELIFAIGEYAAMYEAIVQGARIVKHDMRGFGLSDRDVVDFSLEACVRDLEAVVDALGLRLFAVNSFSETAPIALAFAARHQDVVTGVVLRDGMARRVDMPVDRRVLELIATDWPAATRTLADMTPNLLNVASLRKMQELIANSTTPETLLRYYQAMMEWDASDVLSEIRIPVLVTNDGNTPVPPETSRKLAAALPNGSYVSNVVPRGEPSPSDAAVVSFLQRLAGDVRVQPPAPAGAVAGFRVVLFSDLVGHTEMMRRLGDERGRAVLREHERITRDAIGRHGGTEIKTDGDSFMVSFGSVTSGVDCAIALQRAFAARNEYADERLDVRVGLNAGEPVAEDRDLFGSTVIMASRVCAAAGAGEILIPEPLRHLLSGKQYEYADRGEAVLKGFEDAVRLYEVRWQA